MLCTLEFNSTAAASISLSQAPGQNIRTFAAACSGSCEDSSRVQLQGKNNFLRKAGDYRWNRYGHGQLSRAPFAKPPALGSLRQTFIPLTPNTDIHASRRLDEFWKARLNAHVALNDYLALAA